LRRFIDHGGAVVVTGQQAGLFTGPLYTLHKILTTLRVADALETALAIPVLPVFWNASEDHDWAEVNHAYLLDQADQLQRLSIASADRRPLPMSERTLEADIETTLERLTQLIAGEPEKAFVLDAVRAAYEPGKPVAAAFRQLIASLFGSFDLLITDAADPALKHASVPVLKRELSKAAEHEAILRGTEDQLTRLGLSAQVPILPGASNLFLRTEHGRERLLRERGGYWLARESRERYEPDALVRMMEAEPQRFSPNVLLRPVVESSVFPVVAYVAGPGEISYFAQLKGLFAAHEMRMPLIYPRASFQLVEPRVQSLLEELGVSVDDLRRPLHELVISHSRRQMPGEVEQALQQLREHLVADFDRLGTAAGEVDGTLRGAVAARRNRALLLVEECERKLVRSLTRREAGWAKRLRAAANHLAPLGTAQERVLNGVPFLARHGRALLSELLGRVPLHWRPPADARPSAADGETVRHAL
jgi:bacillithiol synthase